MRINVITQCLVHWGKKAHKYMETMKADNGCSTVVIAFCRKGTESLITLIASYANDTLECILCAYTCVCRDFPFAFKELSFSFCFAYKMHSSLFPSPILQKYHRAYMDFPHRYLFPHKREKVNSFSIKIINYKICMYTKRNHDFLKYWLILITPWGAHNLIFFSFFEN